MNRNTLKWPATAAELKAAGYSGSNWAKCTGPNCDALLYWCVTPNGRRMPLDELTKGKGTVPDEDRVFEPHWGNCADQARFRSAS